MIVQGTAEEIFTSYLGLFEIPKEKAFLNNKKMGIFRRHHLIQGVFNEHDGTIMKNINDTNPEYLI